MGRRRSARGLPVAIRAQKDQNGVPRQTVASSSYSWWRWGISTCPGPPCSCPVLAGAWCMWGKKDEDEPMTGGPAPSFEDAKLRAALAVRVQLGVRMDS